MAGDISISGGDIKTPVGSAPVIPLILMGLGAFMVWFSVRFFRDENLKYPSDVVKSVLQGHGVPAALRAPTTTALLAASIQTAQSETSGALTHVPAGGSYSQSQVEGLWRLAGGSAGAARNAGCHAMQESDGNPNSTSPNPDGGTNVGIWQLDTKGKGAGYTIDQLKDPLTNARITVAATNNGQDWSAWSTKGC